MMEAPFSFAGFSFFDEAHRFVTGLHGVEEFKELVLWRLYAASGGVDNLSHSAKQRFEEGGLSPRISHHIPRRTGRVVTLPVLSAYHCQKCW